MIKPFRAAIYARVSTKKESQSTSIQSQIDSCRGHCERQGWQIIAVHSDERTGRNMDRAGWRAVLDLAESREIDLVVVTHRDRISRNRRDYENMQEELFGPHSVSVVPLMGIQVDPLILQTRWMEEDEVTQAQRFSELLSSLKTQAGSTYISPSSPAGSGR